MGGLRQSSKVNSNLGQLHIITGKITYASGVPSLIGCNDPTATIATTATGDATVTYEAFLAAPAAVASPYILTSDVHWNIQVEQATTTTFEVKFIDDDNTAAIADPADGDGCTFIIIGMRNN